MCQDLQLLFWRYLSHVTAISGSAGGDGLVLEWSGWRLPEGPYCPSAACRETESAEAV